MPFVARTSHDQRRGLRQLTTLPLPDRRFRNFRSNPSRREFQSPRNRSRDVHDVAIVDRFELPQPWRRDDSVKVPQARLFGLYSELTRHNGYRVRIALLIKRLILLLPRVWLWHKWGEKFVHGYHRWILHLRFDWNTSKEPAVKLIFTLNFKVKKYFFLQCILVIAKVKLFQGTIGCNLITVLLKNGEKVS